MFVNIPSDLDYALAQPLAALHTGTWKSQPHVIEALWAQVIAADAAGVNVTRADMARTLRAAGQEPTLLLEAHTRKHVVSM